MSKDFPERIKKLRQALRLTQHGLAARLRVQTQVVASWEQARKEPSAASYQQLAQLAPPKDAWFFLNQIGITKRLVQEKWPRPRRGPDASPRECPSRFSARARKDPLRSQVHIPLLREEAAGDAHAITRRDIEDFLTVPSTLLPTKSGSYLAIPMRGDSMAPLLRNGFIVILDRALRDASRLSGKMVVVEGPEGVLVRWLRRERSGRMVLRSENPAFPDLILRVPAAVRILGRVVSWWGLQA